MLTDFACRLVEDLCGFQDEQGGVPQDEVTFDTDANGITNVSAQDKLGKPRSLFWRSIVLKSWWKKQAVSLAPLVTRTPQADFIISPLSCSLRSQRGNGRHLIKNKPLWLRISEDVANEEDTSLHISMSNDREDRRLNA